MLGLFNNISVAHRREPILYYQALEPFTLDYSAEITPAKLNIDPSATGVGWYMDIELNTNAAVGGSFDILGRNIGGDGRFFLLVLSAALAWRYRTGVNLSVPDFHLTYGNIDSVIIKCVYEATDAVIYINGVEEARAPHLNDFPTGDAVNSSFVGKATDTGLSTCPYGIVMFDINTVKWSMNEGEGLIIESNTGIDVSGGTQDADPEGHFNNDVWKLVE